MSEKHEYRVSMKRAIFQKIVKIHKKGHFVALKCIVRAKSRCFWVAGGVLKTGSQVYFATRLGLT